MTDKTSGKAGSARRSGLLGLTGVVIVLAIVVAVNLLANSINLRADLTEDKIYTLSKGTKNILANLDTPVTLRFYVSAETRSLPQEYKNMTRRVEDFLLEYKKASKGKIRVEKFLVKRDTDEEDSAALDGIQAVGGLLGQDPVYFGISVNCLDKKVALPYIPSRPEILLEYDLSRAITQAVDAEKPKIAIMTSLEVAGGFDPSNFQAGPKPTWVFYQELTQDYDVHVIAPDVEKIVVTTTGGSGEETEAAPDVLVVMHPHDITPQGELAIDQYLLGGGKVMALLDPMFFASRFLSRPPQQPNPMMPPPAPVGTVSTLEKLLAAWGVEFDSTQVVADMTYRTPLQGGLMAPTVLSLKEDAMNREDPVTAQLQGVSFLFSGGFVLDPAPGLQSEVLLASSAQNQLITPGEAEPGPGFQRVIDEFAPSGIDRAYAVRLTGEFKTAFPTGASAEEDAEGDDAEEGKGDDGEKDEEEAADGDLLKKSAEPGVVVLFADADFIYDQFAVQEQNFMGRRFVTPINGNLSLFQNTVEQLAGDANLIDVRSRARPQRPFTKINEMETAAEQRFSAKIQELEQDVRDTQEKLNSLQVTKDEDQKFVLSPEQQAEIENLNKRVVERNRELREVRKDLRRDIDSLIALLKFTNIFAMPLIVLFVGGVLAASRRAKQAAR